MSPRPSPQAVEEEVVGEVEVVGERGRRGHGAEGPTHHFGGARGGNAGRMPSVTGSPRSTIMPPMAKGERLVLVDGSWLVFRAFFAIPCEPDDEDGAADERDSSASRRCSASSSRGACPTAARCSSTCPSRPTASIRFPQYKAQRPPMADELRQQLPYIDRVVAANHFPVIRKPGYEADDLIATLARPGVEAGHGGRHRRRRQGPRAARRRPRPHAGHHARRHLRRRARAQEVGRATRR